ncbi:hypothetical protein V2H45_18455 [Tumidithrix elongata RA019]|uniref:HNH endonuclease n=1 Tax=Tumidithrix elongata BACA0141 TaxID=2716417 RepID=A0AAW9Q2B8_9CYAN|nr:hypothetical protein [Tumidithrix elongata RA019]
MNPNPIILLHPNIPKPLHGLNPRTLLGQEWWDRVRKEAYAKHDYRCHACGVHKSKAKYHRWLEAHEIYRYDFATGRAEMVEIVALCHSCHNFIHDGRMQEIVKAGDLNFTVKKYLDILERGNRLIELHLKTCQGWREGGSMHPEGNRWKHPFQPTQPFQRVFPLVNVPELEAICEETAGWSDWHLIVAGMKFHSQFKDESEWAAHYGALNAKKSVSLSGVFKW